MNCFLVGLCTHSVSLQEARGLNRGLSMVNGVAQPLSCHNPLPEGGIVILSIGLWKGRLGSPRNGRQTTCNCVNPTGCVMKEALSRETKKQRTQDGMPP